LISGSVPRNEVLCFKEERYFMYRATMCRVAILFLLGTFLFSGGVGCAATTPQRAQERQLAQLAVDPVDRLIAEEPELEYPERNLGYATRSGSEAEKVRRAALVTLLRIDDPATTEWRRQQGVVERSALEAREAEVSALREIRARLNTRISVAKETITQFEEREADTSFVSSRLDQLMASLVWVDERLAAAKDMPQSGRALISEAYAP